MNRCKYDRLTAGLPMCSLAAAMLLLLAGCQLGPQVLRAGHQEYGQAVRQIQNEQVLMNLVRLRYADAPMFLDITSISSQFVFRRGGSISGTIVENVGNDGADNPNILGVSGDVGFEERPTITYGLPGGDEFLRSLLAPIEVPQLALVAESGWDGQEVFRIAVEKINGLNNASSASGPTPLQRPEYEDFLEVGSLLSKLTKQGLIRIEYEERREQISDPIPAQKITDFGLVAAVQSGAEYRKNAAGEWVLFKIERVLTLRFAENAKQSADARRLRELLKLDPQRSRFELVDYDESEVDELDPQATWGELALDTRSTLGIMFFMSNAVSVPEEHAAADVVTTTLDPQGRPFDWDQMVGDMMTIHSSKSRPPNAMVSVFYRDHWFYIRDDDPKSKATFTLVLALLSLSKVTVESAKPVLTLPVGG